MTLVFERRADVGMKRKRLGESWKQQIAEKSLG